MHAPAHTAVKLQMACRRCGHATEEHLPQPLSEVGAGGQLLEGKRVCRVVRLVPEGGELVCGCVFR